MSINVTSDENLSFYHSQVDTVSVPEASQADISSHVFANADGTLNDAPGTYSYGVVSHYRADDGSAGSFPTTSDFPGVASLVVEGQVILKLAPGAIVLVGDPITNDAAGLGVAGAAGDMARGISRDESDGTGTADAPHYIRLRMDTFTVA